MLQQAYLRFLQVSIASYSDRCSLLCQGVLPQLAVVLLEHLLGVIRQDRVAVLPSIGDVLL